MSRLNAVRAAARPKMHGRAMISGPSGAGKTWTSLSMATELAQREQRPGEILLIDTEKESALTYADVFTFQHLPWRPPYDPTELTETLTEVGDSYAVVIVDSLSKFWKGLGGTLDIADGKFGGWKSARPVQEALVEAILAVPAHVILGVRSKMAYAVDQSANGKQQVQKIGLAPQQDEDLVYEMNVALDIDLEHRITVTKSRTPAVPVGRMYPAGHEKKAAEDYATWLAGGVPPADRSDVESIVDAFGQIVDAERRKVVKNLFVELFGMPHSLTADKVAEARGWLAEQLDAEASGPDGPEVVPDSGVEPADGGEEQSVVVHDGASIDQSPPESTVAPGDAGPPPLLDDPEFDIDPEPVPAPVAAEPMTDAQSKKLHALLRSVMNAAGPTRFPALSALLDREVTSTKEISKREAISLIDTLESMEEAATAGSTS